jgi:hypothetical protein
MSTPPLFFFGEGDTLSEELRVGGSQSKMSELYAQVIVSMRGASEMRLFM